MKKKFLLLLFYRCHFLFWYNNFFLLIYHSIMNRLQVDEVKQHPQNVLVRQMTSSSNGDDDEIFTKNETNDDQQAHIRRRAPTRHSIKSLTGRKTLTKQSSSTEVKQSLPFSPFLFFFVLPYRYFITLLITQKRENISSGVFFRLLLI